jgi:hypothetical protein
VIVLIVNAIAILSEDRFLARIGWAAQQPEPAFGSGADVSIKGKIINLISATRLLTRSKSFWAQERLVLFCAGKKKGRRWWSEWKLTARSLVPLIGVNSVIIIYELLLG